MINITVKLIKFLEKLIIERFLLQNNSIKNVHIIKNLNYLISYNSNL